MPVDSPLVVFDTRRCPEVVLKPVMFAIIEYVTRAVERHRDEHTQRAAAAATRRCSPAARAAHRRGLASRRPPETGEYANDLARRARHLGLFLIVMSQHLSDFATEHGLALIRNSTMQLLLSQHPTRSRSSRRRCGLSDEEARIIGRLKTVKGSHSQMFWVNGTRGRGRVALRIGPTEYWAFTSDPPPTCRCARPSWQSTTATPGPRSPTSPAPTVTPRGERHDDRTPRHRTRRQG